MRLLGRMHVCARLRVWVCVPVGVNGQFGVGVGMGVGVGVGSGWVGARMCVRARIRTRARTRLQVCVGVRAYAANACACTNAYPQACMARAGAFWLLASLPANAALDSFVRGPRRNWETNSSSLGQSLMYANDVFISSSGRDQIKRS